MRVIFANWLIQNFSSLDESVRLAIAEFVVHVEQQGLRGLKGRNKSSAVSSTTKKGIERFKFAQKHCLWHYHLGVPEYVEQADGDFTSAIIVHYIRFDEFIVLVDIAEHPPFALPMPIKLTYDE